MYQMTFSEPQTHVSNTFDWKDTCLKFACVNCRFSEQEVRSGAVNNSTVIIFGWLVLTPHFIRVTLDSPLKIQIITPVLWPFSTCLEHLIWYFVTFKRPIFLTAFCYLYLHFCQMSVSRHSCEGPYSRCIYSIL